MFNFLHTFQPDPILFSWDGITVYWYGFFIVIGIIAGILVISKLAPHYNIDKNTVLDLGFWMMIAGIIGARIYHVLLELPHYTEDPSRILKVWQGGMAIHGAIIAGIITLYIFARKRGINFWKLGAVTVPGVALAQSIGRWGNYFNQELFGKPTDLPWGIPIDIMNRPAEYISFEFFHPAFLYESLGSLCIFLALIGLHIHILKKNKTQTYYYFLIIISYLALYSLLRAGTEFIRIDETPIWFGVRFPQLVSGIIIIAGMILLLFPSLRRRMLTTEKE